MIIAHIAHTVCLLPWTGQSGLQQLVALPCCVPDSVLLVLLCSPSESRVRQVSYC